MGWCLNATSAGGKAAVSTIDQLDPAFEHRARLAIAVLLAARDEISFSRFKDELELTDGNLGAQLRRLEDAGYIVLRREFAKRKPITWYRLTREGRVALDSHLSALQALIAPALNGTS